MEASLKLGNGNWATKEDSLLSYGDENGNFRPLPFDFTRGSTATVINKLGLMETVDSGIARIDFQGTADGSLLLEPASTNLIPYSQNFGATDWFKTRCTIDSGGHTSPSGESNAFKMTATYDDARLQDGSGAASVVYTQSIYIKSATGSDVSGQVDFTGTQIQTFTATSQWQRVDTTSDDTRAGVVRVRITNSGDKLYIWGAQLEQGSYATSYIPTSGSTVTRNQDIFTRDGIGSLINSTEGVLFVEMAALSDDGTDRRITLSDGSVSDQVIIGLSRFASNINAEIHSGGVLQTSGWGGTGVTQTNNNKFAISWGSGTMKFYINGSPISTQTGITSPIGLNSLKFSLGNNTLNMFGKVKQLQVFKTALTDAELQTLTTL